MKANIGSMYASRARKIIDPKELEFNPLVKILMFSGFNDYRNYRFKQKF